MHRWSRGSSGTRSTARNQIAWRGSPGDGSERVLRLDRPELDGALPRAGPPRPAAGTGPASASQRWFELGQGRSASGGGTSGIGAECSSPSSGVWKEAIIERMGRPCWIACTRLRREALPVADALHLVDDRGVRVPGQQEVGVERVGDAPLDGPLGGDQRLADHLAAEHPGAPQVLRLAAEEVHLELLEVELADQGLQRVVHGVSPGALSSRVRRETERIKNEPPT